MNWTAIGIISIGLFVAIGVPLLARHGRRAGPAGARDADRSAAPRCGLHGHRFGLTLVLLCLIFFAAYLLNEQKDRQQQIKSFQIMEWYDAQMAADMLQQEIGILQSQLRVLARNPNVIRLDDTGKKLLRDHFFLDLKPKPWARALTRISNTGQILFTTPDESFTGSDLSNQPHQQLMMKKQESLVSLPFRAVQGFLAVSIMEPVLDGDRFAGALAVGLDLNALTSKYIHPVTTGGLAIAGMINQDGMILSSTNANFDGRTLLELGQNSPSLNDCINRIHDRDSGVDSFVFDRGERKSTGPVRELFGYARVRLTPQESWTIFVTAREPEVLVPMQAMRWPRIYGAAIFSLLVILASLKHLRDERRYTSTLEGEIQHRMADLRQSEGRFQQLFEQSTVGLMILDMQGNLLDVNRAVSAIFGVPLDRFTGYNILQDAEWDQNGQRPAINQVLAGQAVSFETSYRVGRLGPFADLPPRTIHLGIQFFPLLDEQGQPLNIMLACLDIAGAKRSEASLQKINRALKTLSNGNKILVRAQNEEQLLTGNCRSLTETGGYQVAWVAFTDPAQPARLMPAAQSSRVVGDPGDLHRTENGAWTAPTDHPASRALQEWRVCVEPIPDSTPNPSPWREAAIQHGLSSVVALPLGDRDQPLGVLCLYAHAPDAFDRDELPLLEELCADLSYGLVTLRQRAEHNQTAEARKLLTTAVEQVGEAIFITDVRGIVHYVNPSFKRLTGYDAAEAVGRNPHMLISAKHGRDHYAGLVNAVREGQPWTGQVVFQRKDGCPADVEVMISPVRDEYGTIIHYVAVCRDVTMEKNLEEQLRQSQKMDAIGKLAGGVAHDFNNLLTGIMGNIEMAQIKNAGKGDRHLGEALQACQRATELVRQLLTFSRKSSDTRMAVELGRIVQEVAGLVGKTIDRRITVKVVPMDEPRRVLADPNQIHQVLMNLCVNARDTLVERQERSNELKEPGNGHTAEPLLTLAAGEETVTEDYCRLFSYARPGRFAVLSVADNGLGMDAETQARIFEPFFTTKDAGKGTGLGLSTVYGIVKAHNGWVHVTSRPGAGSTFKIYLPQLDHADSTPELLEFGCRS